MYRSLRQCGWNWTSLDGIRSEATKGAVQRLRGMVSKLRDRERSDFRSVVRSLHLKNLRPNGGGACLSIWSKEG